MCSVVGEDSRRGGGEKKREESAFHLVYPAWISLFPHNNNHASATSPSFSSATNWITQHPFSTERIVLSSKTHQRRRCDDLIICNSTDLVTSQLLRGSIHACRYRQPCCSEHSLFMGDNKSVLSSISRLAWRVAFDLIWRVTMQNFDRIRNNTKNHQLAVELFGHLLISNVPRMAHYMFV